MKIIKTSSNDQTLDSARKFIKSTQNDWNYITSVELKEKGLKSFYILDIRKPEAFEEGHIKGAKNIFWLDLLDDENLDLLPKNKTILLVCYVGHTASQALVLLRMLWLATVTQKSTEIYE